MSNVVEFFSRVIGPIIFVVALSVLVLHVNNITGILTSTKDSYESDRVYSQRTDYSEVVEKVCSARVIAQILSQSGYDIVVHSRIDGGWYETSIEYATDHAFRISVTNQIGSDVYSETVTSMNEFPADSYVGKGTYSVLKEYDSFGDVMRITYTYVSEGEVYDN